MEMIIGRLGDQKIVINERTVSRKHVKVEIKSDGSIYIENLSPNGTFVNNVKTDKGYVKKTDMLRLGPTFARKVEELLIKKEVPSPIVDNEKSIVDNEKTKGENNFDVNKIKNYISYKQVLKDYKKKADIEHLLEFINKSKSLIPSHVQFIVMTALARKLMREGLLSESQQLLYKAGDLLYASLDGSIEKESCYASIMLLLSELYKEAFYYEESETAASYAVGIYNRWTVGEGCIRYNEVGDAYKQYGDALKRSSKNELAKACYNKAIELFTVAGKENPVLFSAKISEVTMAMKNL